MGPDKARNRVVFVLGLLAGLSVCAPVRGQTCYEIHPIVCTTNSETEFISLQLGQPLRFLDFETLPNGQPSVSGTQITPLFNYTSQGVTFSAPVGTPVIGGSAGQHYLLVSVLNPLGHTWLRADFVHASRGAGIYFGGATTLTAFDADGSMIASMHYGFSGGPWFIGIVSEIPIAYVTVDRGSNAEAISDFIFNPVPEPASVILFGVMALLAGARHRLQA